MDINTAVRIIRSHIFDYLREMRGGRNAGRTGLIEAANTIYDYTNEKEKYRWHDMRRNPEDLPERGKRVLFYTVGYEDSSEKRYWTGEYYLGDFCNDDYEAYITLGDYPISDVIAWRYIDLVEPLEEGKDE